ncbi:MAG TPA: DUF4397 domain-containing protein [Streptosporangiaceae bacterium]|nr:DUF4397 domain-containing protein [Streptosporangiaceae bacterium]
MPITTARRATAVTTLLITGLLLAVALLLLNGLLITGTARAATGTGTGWLRLAHLSPNAPAVDVYLYNFGNPNARLVLHHVSYGTVSSYQQVPAGEYTVAMRAAGAKGSAPPILSTGFAVHSGGAYTVAGVGPAAGLRLQVMDDKLTAPSGRALVRVIQASLRQHVVTLSLDHRTLARNLSFASTTGYQQVTPGQDLAQVTGTGEKASMNVSLPADSIQTIVVLDGSGGLRLDALKNAAGSQIQPTGGAQTGLGGTAPRPGPSPLPWIAVLGLGTALATLAARRLHATRYRPLHHRRTPHTKRA